MVLITIFKIINMLTIFSRGMMTSWPLPRPPTMPLKKAANRDEFRKASWKRLNYSCLCSEKVWRWTSEPKRVMDSTVAVPNLSGTKDQFCGRQVFHRLGLGNGYGMMQMYYICYAASHRRQSSGDNGVMGSSCKYRWSFACQPTAHLLLCAPVPIRPGTGTRLWPRGWGLLLQRFRWDLWSLFPVSCTHVHFADNFSGIT